jgi:pyruvate kinase
MLSGETAMGKYPSQALSIMSKIAVRIERDIDYSEHSQFHQKPVPSITNAISHATVTISHDLQTEAILTVTLSGNTARNLAKFRPESVILACTPDPTVQRKLKLIWGVVPLLTEWSTDTSALFNQSIDVASYAGYIKQGDIVVLTAGIPIGQTGTTNLLKVHVIGEQVLSDQIFTFR